MITLLFVVVLVVVAILILSRTGLLSRATVATSGRPSVSESTMSSIARHIMKLRASPLGCFVIERSYRAAQRRRARIG